MQRASFYSLWHLSRSLPSGHTSEEDSDIPWLKKESAVCWLHLGFHITIVGAPDFPGAGAAQCPRFHVGSVSDFQILNALRHLAWRIHSDFLLQLLFLVRGKADLDIESVSPASG